MSLISPKLPHGKGHIPSDAVNKTQETLAKNTAAVLPEGGMAAILSGSDIVIHKGGDDLVEHQDRIDAIDSYLIRASDAAKKGLQDISLKVRGDEGKDWKALNDATDNLVKGIDKARSEAAHGDFAQAEQTCAHALKEFEGAFRHLEGEFSEHIDGKFDKAIVSKFFHEAKDVISNSLHKAEKTCGTCDSYLAELNKAASAPVKVPDKAEVAAALKELQEARESLQDIWDGKSDGDVGEAKQKVKDNAAKCHALIWAPANAAIAKKMMQEKAQLAASLISKTTAQEVIDLATQKFGTLEKPGIVTLHGSKFEVASGIKKGGHQVIRLPNDEIILGKGAWNVVTRVCNTSQACFQALRLPISPPGVKPPGEEQILHSIEVYSDISGLEGTTVGPEALIRRGTGGILSSLYNDDVIKWLKMMPPPELRWECFKSTLMSVAEFAREGNVHGDIHPGNLSVVYKQGKDKAIPATPGKISIEDLDGACKMITGYEKDGAPIYSEKAIEVGIVCKYATQSEVNEWDKCIKDGDLEGIANVRFGQDILAAGITLYQILTLDFDISNTYLTKECAPLTDKDGIVPGKFEEGIFLDGKPNKEAVRLALEEYRFLSAAQKSKVIEFISLAITQDPQKRATLHDLEQAVSI